MFKVFKWFMVFSFVFLFNCAEDKNGSSTDRTRDRETSAAEIVTNDQKNIDRDNSPKQDAEKKKNRLRQKDLVIRTDTNNRYSSSKSTSSFTGGRECDEYDACRAICDRIIKSSRSRCYRFSYTVVEDMDDALFTIRSIDEANRVDIDPYIFEAILTVNKSIISDLVEDEMGEGDLKSFLAWVALNEDIADVLEAKDRSGDILETAFEQLGKLQEGAAKNDEEFAGLNTGLITDDDTFLYLAADEENEAAFTMAYDILSSSSCKKIACQEQILCAREYRSRSRSSYRYFGNTRGVAICRTSAEGSRRLSPRSGNCYVHGSIVWSYLYELVDDGDLKGTPKELEKKPLGVDRCNDVCGRSSGSSKQGKCDLVNPEALR